MTTKKTRTFYPPSNDDHLPDVKTITNTAQAMVEYGLNYGETILRLTDQNIKDLIRGKCLACSDEFTTFIIHADSLDDLHATCTESKHLPGHFEYQFPYEPALPKRKRQN
jgi:hypothetical protein